MIGSLIQRIESASRAELAVLLTLLVLLLHNPGPVAPFVVVACVVGLVHRPLAETTWFWLGLAALRVVSIGPNAWLSIDNHHYLLTWWCVALGLAFLFEDPDEALRSSSRWLLILTFAVAVSWKILSPDFLNGDFFEVVLLHDPRMQALAHGVGLSAAEAVANRSAILELLGPGGPEQIALVTTGGLRPLAQFMAIGTVVVEALVAIAVLFHRRVTSLARSLLIGVFVFTTYVIAPIVGFGWTVLVLGITQSSWTEHSGRVGLSLSFLALPGVAYAATLEELAIPTLLLMAAVALVLAWIRMGAAWLRDLALLLLLVAGGVLVATEADTPVPVLASLGVALVGIALLRASSRRAPGHRF